MKKVKDVPAVSYETVLEWSKKAKLNCSAQGMNQTATLWGDAIEWLEYLKHELEKNNSRKR